MKANAIPVKMPVIWGAGAGGSFIRTVPVPSQIGVEPGAASFTDGFPPLTMTPTSLGGIPPYGQDMNGALNPITAWLQWTTQAGVLAIYDNIFSSAIGGYPEGALIQSAVTTGLFWLSTKDDNTSNPDAGGNGWTGVWPRAALTANQNFYVSTTGNNSNSGLSSGQAWLTLQHAYNVLSSRYDLNGFNATVMVADGTYADGVTAPGGIVGASGPGSFTFASSSGNASACIVSSADDCFQVKNDGSLMVQDITLTSSAGNGIFAFDGGHVAHSGCIFGAAANAHLHSRTGARITSSDDYTITGNAAQHMLAEYNGVIRQAGGAVTLTGTPAFSAAFASAVSGGVITFQASPTFTGSATGSRYSVTGNGVIDTNAAGATYLPGNASGTSATGGQYI